MLKQLLLKHTAGLNKQTAIDRLVRHLIRERQSNNPPLKRPVDPAAADQNGTAYSLLSGLL